MQNVRVSLPGADAPYLGSKTLALSGRQDGGRKVGFENTGAID